MNTVQNIIITLLVLFSVRIHSQGAVTPLPKRFINTVYDVKFLKISDNKRWLSFQKSYETNSDTMVIVDVRKPDRIYYQKPDAVAFYTTFTNNGYLFSRGRGDVEILKLPSLKPVKWNDVKEGFYDKKENTIILLRDKTLTVMSEEGQMLGALQGVKKIIGKGESRFAVVSGSDEESLFRISGRNFKKIYTSPNQISSVISDNHSSLILIEEKGDKKEIKWVDGSESKVLHFNNGSEASIKTAEAVSLKEGKQYLLKVLLNKKRREKDDVDIWFSNDKTLQTKFYDDTVENTLLWEPLVKKVTVLTATDDHKMSFFGNPDHLLSFNPFQHQDYRSNGPKYSVKLYNVQKDREENLQIDGRSIISDPKGRFLLNVKNNYWQLYDLATLSQKQIPLQLARSSKYKPLKVYFSDDGERIVFEGIGKMSEYIIKDGVLRSVPLIEGYESEILNGNRDTYINGFNFYTNTYKPEKPLLIKLYDRNNNKTALVSYDGKKIRIIIKPTEESISVIVTSRDMKDLMYCRSTMGSPPTIIFNTGNKERELFKTNKHDRNTLKGLRSEIMTYQNKNGDSLKGVLIYPLNYTEDKKYPMVVSIYEKQLYFSNKYLKDGFDAPSAGLNVRDFVQKGYFIFLPDIVFGKKGTGESALDCVHSGLDALEKINEIDFDRVGLIGFSHGGYETNFIATRSKRFAAYVAGAGNSDLVRSYFSYNYNFNSPFYFQFENGQYEMDQPFFSDKNLYTDNSPIYHADSVSAPILLWTGTKDQNINWEQTMQYFLSLKRSGKPSIALFYPEEGHGLRKTKNQLDLFIRVEDWFDYFLKQKNTEWIRKGLEEE
ncbi:prolyl oligopeptidase family serine peptidase [Chryseobacterium sp. ISL-6]|uniref:alpha/beta hydrolase family protein n=1 Tax=Chryseobacterium sp. ISL-6 TaxID=2819143 RepID=UPI001BE57326|nr:prolyl oligopeptidase family serine peptidase [Chryseobacterium sp. ISL-6]MBT2623677.1 S9 family peptidase [Chryseobacterium sp. ISL-6]